MLRFVTLLFFGLLEFIAGLGIAAVILIGVLCAGSGPNGAWTADDFAAVNRGVSDAVTTYERVRYPDRPQFRATVNPPGAPFELYPPTP